jgi:hypothetical protein
MKTALEQFIEKLDTEWVYGVRHLKKLGKTYMRKEKKQIIDAFNFRRDDPDNLYTAANYFKNHYDWEEKEKQAKEAAYENQFK